RARDLAGAAVRLLEAVPEAIQDRLDVRNALAGALYYRGRLDEAEHYLAAQLPDAEALGYPDMLCRLHANRGLILLLKGHVPAPPPNASAGQRRWSMPTWRQARSASPRATTRGPATTRASH